MMKRTNVSEVYIRGLEVVGFGGKSGNKIRKIYKY